MEKKKNWIILIYLSIGTKIICLKDEFLLAETKTKPPAVFIFSAVELYSKWPLTIDLILPTTRN